ncbi:MAG: tRNA pseudouridine(38-40) synthase TruA [Gammaproteobacteria bacterium]|nr:MAG: tRNA pseudouridine(38-40) synthase TruA [Gammaproteobacteria bacterium]
MGPSGPRFVFQGSSTGRSGLELVDHMRIALRVEYDGFRYAGWQIQKDATTIQSVLQKALSQVAAEPVSLVCAGRTDAGVHAMNQVVHFDTNAKRSMRSWVLGANSLLPPDVAVKQAQSMAQEFHARFSAISRSYRYLITNQWVRSALTAKRAYWHCRRLDEQRMHQAAQYLLGEHDFTSFRAFSCQARHPVRTISRLDVTREGVLVTLDIEANAFLHHMVRNIAGVLIEIGRGDKDPGWVRTLLELKDRTRGGVTAPAHGLYLINVIYPEKFNL